MSKLPAQPIKPSYDLEIKDEESRQAWVKYFDDYKKWESKAAVIGREYGDQYIHDLAFTSSIKLVNWLKENNAPEEVVTVAENAPHLQYSYLEYADSRHIMDNSSAARRAKLAIETFRALRKMAAMAKNQVRL